MPGVGLGDWLRSQLELSRSTGAVTLLPMEGLRGLAVLLVFLVHYASLVKPWVSGQVLATQVLEGVHAIGNVGVDLFFVLSGFLIYGSLLVARQPLLGYLRRRVRRIYPAFLAVFALCLLLSIALRRTEPMPAEAGAAALYIAQNLLLLPGLLPIKPLITVAWSLSYEFFFYLLMPLVIALFSLRERSRGWRIGFVGCLTIVALLGFAAWGGPVRMAMFLAGMLLHELLGAGRGLSALAGTLAGAFALAVPLVDMPGPALQAVRVGLIYVGFLGLCLAAFRQPGHVLGRALSWGPLRWMGNISYSYYLLHGLALQVFFAGLQRLMPSGDGLLVTALLVPAWLATLPPCLALYLLIERPLSLAPKPAAARALVAPLKT